MSCIVDFFHSDGGGGRKIFGVKFDGVNSIGTRMLDSVGLNFTPSSTTTAGIDDFITIQGSPFHIRECISDYNTETGKQKIISYEGDSKWDNLVANKIGNRMIEFPKFYYKRPSKWEFQVSSYPYDGFLPSPMHYRNKVMHDCVYVAKYMANSEYKSQSGQTIFTQTTTNYNQYIPQFKSQGMYCWDYALWCSLTILMIIKYKNLDVQKAVGRGVADQSGPVNTGLSDSIKGKDGYSGATISDDGSNLAFGIENCYSNVSKILMGVQRIGTSIYVNTNPDTINDYPTSTSGYNLVPTNIFNGPNTNDIAYITDIVFDSQYPWCLFPTQAVDCPVSDDHWRPDYGNITGDLYWSSYRSGINSTIVTTAANYSAGNGCGMFTFGPYMTQESMLHTNRQYVGAASFFLS